MKENKTKQTNENVEWFLSSIEEDQKREDCQNLLDIMQEITQQPPKMWGTSIVGFGEYHYKYKTGREGDWFLTGFAPRKQALTLYLMCDLSHDGLDFEGLGKYKKGKGCLYVKRLSDVNLNVLKRIIKDSIKIIEEKYS
ncbi:MAG: DUF1801 domain-containing protein [Flavobacteriaceae bacterium]